MNAQSNSGIVGGVTAAVPVDQPEVLARLARAENCAEQLTALIDLLSNRLSSVTREQGPSAGSALKEVKYSAPLAAQIDVLADLLTYSINNLESVLSRLEI